MESYVRRAAVIFAREFSQYFAVLNSQTKSPFSSRLFSRPPENVRYLSVPGLTACAHRKYNPSSTIDVSAVRTPLSEFHINRVFLDLEMRHI